MAKAVDESEFIRGLREEAKRERLPINVGIHEPAAQHNESGKHRVKNTLVWINEDGEIIQRYQKVHLFDVDIAGGPALKESE